MEAKYTFSIVVPVYRIPEQLLHRCLTSLAKQSCKNAEFIIVDDGSPDNCGVICDEFAEKDKRFRVFHCENRGVSSARNFGIEKSTGTWLLFVDADDYVSSDLLSFLEEYLSQHNNQVTFFQFRDVDEQGDLLKKETLISNEECPDSLTIAAAIASAESEGARVATEGISYGTPWGKVFNRDFIRSSRASFPIGVKKKQDAAFMLEVLSGHPSLGICDRVGYFYTHNENSICRAYRPDGVFVLDEAAFAIKESIRHFYSEKEREYLLECAKLLDLTLFFEGVGISLAHKSCPYAYSKRMKLFLDE